MAIVSYNPISIDEGSLDKVLKANSPLKYIIQIEYSTADVDNSLPLLVKKNGVTVGSFVLVRYTEPVYSNFSEKWSCYFICDCIGLIASDLDKQLFSENTTDVIKDSTVYEFLVNGVYSHSSSFCNASAQYGEYLYFWPQLSNGRVFYVYVNTPIRLWYVHWYSNQMTLSYNGHTKVVPDDGTGTTSIKHIDTIYQTAGVFDFVASTTNANYTSKVHVLPLGCKTELLKYVDRNGMVQCWAFESIKTDTSSITGRYSAEQIYSELDNSNIKGLAADRSKSIKLKTGLIEKSMWPIIEDIISSPVVMYRNSNSKWISVEVQTKQIDTSKMRYNFFDFDIEIKLPRQYTVKYF